MNSNQYAKGKRFAKFKNRVGAETEPPWVPNAESYDLKINNENVQYLDVFNNTEETSSGPVNYFLEELIIQFLNENYVDIELELAKHQPTSLTMDTVLCKSTPPVTVLPL